MKTVKRLVATVALSLMAVAAFAQFRPSIIANVGYQGSNISNYVGDTKINSGLRAGVAFDFAVADLGMGEFSIQPGIYYAMKGAKLSEVKLGDSLFEKIIGDIVGAKDVSYSQKLHYIEIPVLANVRFDVMPGMKVYVNAGPYIGYGVGSTLVQNKDGKLTTVTDGDGNSFNVFKKYGEGENAKSAYNPFDWGLQVGAGLEYSRIMLGVSGQFGLYDIMAISDKQSNTGFAVTLGYRF